MSLEDIKARAEVNSVLGKTASQDEAKDTLKLIAALEAAEALCAHWETMAAESDPGFGRGVLMGSACALRATIAEALA